MPRDAPRTAGGDRLSTRAGCAKGSNGTCLIEYSPIDDIQRRNKSNRKVFRNLVECGPILDTAFDPDSAGTLDEEPSNRLTLNLIYAAQEINRGKLADLFATVLDPELIGHWIELPPERIRLVRKDGAVTQLAGSGSVGGMREGGHLPGSSCGG